MFVFRVDPVERVLFLPVNCRENETNNSKLYISFKIAVRITTGPINPDSKSGEFLL